MNTESQYKFFPRSFNAIERGNQLKNLQPGFTSENSNPYGSFPDHPSRTSQYPMKMAMDSAPISSASSSSYAQIKYLQPGIQSLVYYTLCYDVSPACFLHAAVLC